MKPRPQKTVGVYERPEKKAIGLKIAIAAAIVMLLAVLVAIFLLR
jgi:hypothetical protein